MDKQELADTRYFLIRNIRALGIVAIPTEIGDVTIEQYVDIALCSADFVVKLFMGVVWLVSLPHFGMIFGTILAMLIWLLI